MKPAGCGAPLGRGVRIGVRRRDRGRFRLGATSPFSSWTRNPASTPNCGHGRRRPAARLVDFDDEGSSRRRATKGGGPMQVLYPRCAGLDVHKDTVVACVRCVSPPHASRDPQLRDHDPRAARAGRLARQSHGCTHVAMEATGVYWRPVWHVLEDSFELVLANAQHIRNVPGRKTDVNDAMWIADLLAHGLIRSSFVPPAADPGAARPDPHPQAAGARDRASIRCASRRCSRTPTSSSAACSPTC